MAYNEVARTVSTQGSVGIGYTVTAQEDGYCRVKSRTWIDLPGDHEAWVTLPERDDVSCAACGCKTVTFYRDVVTCRCGERWRWPGVGGD